MRELSLSGHDAPAVRRRSSFAIQFVVCQSAHQLDDIASQSGREARERNVQLVAFPTTDKHGKLVDSISNWFRRPSIHDFAEEIRRGHTEDRRNLLKPARADPVRPFFVFLYLLERDAQLSG